LWVSGSCRFDFDGYLATRAAIKRRKHVSKAARSQLAHDFQVINKGPWLKQLIGEGANGALALTLLFAGVRAFYWDCLMLAAFPSACPSCSGNVIAYIFHLAARGMVRHVSRHAPGCAVDMPPA
jgi:hypothetical protein